jgi:sugar/nucleoside kinase (ribokinase family)
MSKNRGRELRQLFASISAAGVVTSLDMSLPDPDHASGRLDWAGILARTLPFVDVFAPSLDEALYFLGDRTLVPGRPGAVRLGGPPPMSSYRRVAERFLAMGCAAVLLKAGSEGIYLRSGGFARVKRIAALTGRDAGEWAYRDLMAPALRVRKIVNTTGAGDASLGGFLASLLRRRGAEQALEAAVAVGAQSLQGPDASSGVMSWSQTTALLKGGRRGVQRRPLTRDASARDTGIHHGSEDLQIPRDLLGGP